VGNTELGVRASLVGTPPSDVDATGNWWGDAMGPYNATLNPGGLGDAVTLRVDFDPWSAGPNTAFPPFPPPPGVKGDTSGDGVTDITDARLAAEHAIGIIDLSVANPPQWTAGADARADVAPPLGTIDITDARWIAEAAIGLRVLGIATEARTAPTSESSTATISVDATGALMVSGADAELADLQGTLYYDTGAFRASAVVGLNGFQVLASEIDQAAGTVRFAAAKLSGGMATDGALVRFEGTGDPSGSAVAIDVLRDVRARDIPYEVASSMGARILSFGNTPNPVEDVHTTRFSVKGTLPVDEIRVEIFDFSGRPVYDSGWGPNDLAWHLENDAGDVLANGVYYYRIQVKFVGQAEPEVSGLQKLAIYR